jgi:hypothetical protein
MQKCLKKLVALELNSMITELKENQVFVFGSNTNGYHYGGAAYQAMVNWGAIRGIGSGRQGKTYAIPTLDTDMSKLPLETIKEYLQEFRNYAKIHPNTEFLLTRIGLGIAGFTEEEMESIMPIFPSNVIKV